MKDTTRVGTLSQLKVAAKFLELGATVSIPVGESERYDLVVDTGEKLLRVQVKTGRLRDGVVRINAYSVSANMTTKKYTGQVDGIAAYCPATEKVYWIPAMLLAKTRIWLRVEPSKNQQELGVNLAKNFEISTLAHLV